MTILYTGKSTCVGTWDSLIHWYNSNYSRLHTGFQTAHLGFSMQVHYIEIHPYIGIYTCRKKSPSWNLLKIIKLHENESCKICWWELMEWNRWLKERSWYYNRGKKEEEKGFLCQFYANHSLLWNCCLPEAGLEYYLFLSPPPPLLFIVAKQQLLSL